VGHFLNVVPGPFSSVSYTNIQDGYNEVYEKRHQRIEEKKAALQEQATQEAEQPDEPQPEAEAQTEPQAEEIAA